MKTILAGDRMGGVFFDIQQERNRQLQLLRAGKFPFACEDPTVPDAHRLPILAEEFGEVSREVNEQIGREYLLGKETQAAVETRFASRKRLRAELIQVAAVAVAWVEGLDDEEEGAER